MEKKAVKRKRKSTDHPICRYGSSCYRKNPDHIKRYHSKRIAESIQDEASNGSLSDSETQETSNKIVTPEYLVSTNTAISEENAEKLQPSKETFSETVDDVLKSMPEDFFDFWKFCSSINKSKPHEAFSKIGLHLVGVYDLLANNFPKQKEVVLHTHWRYYYDPPEFQTVVKSDDNDLYHIGYFRDDPDELPSILASNKAKIGPELSLKGDNIFAAMNAELTERIKKLDTKTSREFSEIQEKLQKYAIEKKYSLDILSSKAKARQKKVVAKTFHGLGIVVPFENDVGYRPLPYSNAKMKSILQRIATATTEEEKARREDDLDYIITTVNFANDECDTGMGLELGIDLFCFGDSCFDSRTLNLLTIAYELLKRPKYKEVIRCHLEKRRSKNLSTL